MSNANYDGRTALHLAAAEGHASCVKFLVESCKLNPLAKDRFVHGISLILPVSLGLSILYFGTLVGWCDIDFDLLLYRYVCQGVEGSGASQGEGTNISVR